MSRYNTVQSDKPKWIHKSDPVSQLGDEFDLLTARYGAPPAGVKGNAYSGIAVPQCFRINGGSFQPVISFNGSRSDETLKAEVLAWLDQLKALIESDHELVYEGVPMFRQNSRSSAAESGGSLS